MRIIHHWGPIWVMTTVCKLEAMTQEFEDLQKKSKTYTPNIFLEKNMSAIKKQKDQKL